MTHLDRIADSLFDFALAFTRVWITLAVILGTLGILVVMVLAPVMGIWYLIDLALGRGGLR